MLKALNTFLIWVQDLAIRRSGWMLGLSVCAILFGAAGMGKIRTLLKIQDVLDHGSAASQSIRSLNTEFEIGNDSTLLLVPPDGRLNFTPVEYCEILHWLEEERSTRADLIRSVSVFDLRNAVTDGKRLLYPPFVRVECGEGDNAEEIAHGYAELRKSPYSRIFAASSSVQDVLIDLDFKNAPPNGKFGTFDPKVVELTRQSLEREVLSKIPRAKVFWFGEADFQHYVLEGIQQAGLLNLMVIALLVLTLRAFFGTWKTGALFVLALILIAILVYGSMGWVGAPLDVLTNSLFLMLAVAALEDFVFIAHERLRFPNGTWQDAFRKLLLPGFFTSLTTVFGFFSLCGAGGDVIPRFGFWAGVGALLEFVAVFWLLPSLIARFPKLGDFADSSRVWLKLPEIQNKRISKKWVLGALMVFPLAAASSFHLTIYDAPLFLFPKGHPMRQAAEYAKASRGWESSIDVVFSDFRRGDFNRAVIAQLSKLPDVVAIQDPYSILDSVKSGKRALTQDLIEHDFLSTHAFKRMVSESGTARASLYISNTDLSSVQSIEKEVSRVCPNRECYATGTIVAYADFTESIPRTLLQSFLTSLALVVGLILWLARQKKMKNDWALAVSSLWGPALMLVVMVLFKVKINLMTCMFASVLVGLTGDNAVQFILGSDEEGTALASGISKRGGASAICSVLMASASLLFLFSYFGPPHTFGLLLSAGLIAALFGDIWILRGLLR